MSSKKSPTSISIPMEDQERSIKARKNQLFDPTAAEEAPAPTKMPFAAYLKTVPATPATPGQKQAFWTVAAIVLILFLASLLSLRR